MEEIKLSSGIKKIAIKDEDGDLITVITVDTANADTAKKFAGVIDKLNNISQNCEKEAAEWRKNHKDDINVDDINVDDINVDAALELNSIRVKYLKQITESIDGLFGEDAMKQIYGDIVPDELAIVEFVEQVIPVMNKLFNKRFEQVQNKYNIKRRGAK